MQALAQLLRSTAEMVYRRMDSQETLVMGDSSDPDSGRGFYFDDPANLYLPAVRGHPGASSPEELEEVLEAVGRPSREEEVVPVPGALVPAPALGIAPSPLPRSPRQRRPPRTIKERAEQGATKLGVWRKMAVATPQSKEGVTAIWVPEDAPHGWHCALSIQEASVDFKGAGMGESDRGRWLALLGGRVLLGSI